MSQQPLSWRAHYFYGDTSIAYGFEMEGIWHIVLANFLAKQFPNEPDMQLMERFKDMSLEERILHAPEILQPRSPCRMALEIVGTVKGHLSLYEELRSKYGAVYGECIAEGCNTLLRDVNGGQFVLLQKIGQ